MWNIISKMPVLSENKYLVRTKSRLKLYRSLWYNKIAFQWALVIVEETWKPLGKPTFGPWWVHDRPPSRKWMKFYTHSRRPLTSPPPSFSINMMTSQYRRKPGWDVTNGVKASGRLLHSSKICEFNLCVSFVSLGALLIHIIILGTGVSDNN